MNALDIPYIDDEGELRCAKCGCSQPMPGATLCESCAATCNPCPPGCVADCAACLVEECGTCEVTP